MTTESLTWFAAQLAVLVPAALAGRWAGRSRRLGAPLAFAAVAVMLLWPLMRVFPAAAIQVLPLEAVVFAEVTGITVPAAFLFAVAGRMLKRPADRRAVSMMLIVVALYFVKGGLWMVRPPPPDFKSSKYVDGVCRQSTGYTCVAASLVTLLSAKGIASSEGEMARLSYTEVGNGTTDTRAILALRRKLRGAYVDVRFEQMSFERLREIELPALVPLKWGYFVSHMVPVLEIDADGVLIGDPLTGARRMRIDEFRGQWLGRGIHLADKHPVH